jgi:preprotein translocase subunit YajC
MTGTILSSLSVTPGAAAPAGGSWILAAAAPAAGGLGSLLTSPVVPMVLMFAVFYVVLILPMRKRQRALQQQIDNLKKGDRVVTNGGLYGEVAAIEPTVVLLKVADNVRLRVAKSAIAGLEGDGDKGAK